MKTSSRFIFKDGQQKSGCKASFAFRFALRRELNQFTLVQSRQNEEISMVELFTFGCSRLFGLQDQLYPFQRRIFLKVCSGLLILCGRNITKIFFKHFLIYVL